MCRSHFPMLQATQVVKYFPCHYRGVTPFRVKKWSVCFRSGLSTVTSSHRNYYTHNAQENISKWKSRLELHSPKEDQKAFM